MSQEEINKRIARTLREIYDEAGEDREYSIVEIRTDDNGMRYYEKDGKRVYNKLYDGSSDLTGVTPFGKREIKIGGPRAGKTLEQQKIQKALEELWEEAGKKQSYYFLACNPTLTPEQKASIVETMNDCEVD